VNKINIKSAVSFFFFDRVCFTGSKHSTNPFLFKSEEGFDKGYFFEFGALLYPTGTEQTAAQSKTPVSSTKPTASHTY